MLFSLRSRLGRVKDCGSRFLGCRCLPRALCIDRLLSPPGSSFKSSGLRRPRVLLASKTQPRIEEVSGKCPGSRKIRELSRSRNYLLSASHFRGPTEVFKLYGYHTFMGNPHCLDCGSRTLQMNARAIPVGTQERLSAVPMTSPRCITRRLVSQPPSLHTLGLRWP